MDFSFTLKKKDKKTHARTGVIKTSNGVIHTPAFSPVATKASIKSLDPDDIRKTNSQVVLANTYHLYLQPGIDVIGKFGGFANFMRWSGPTITDSGGYQVAFLWEGGKKETKESHPMNTKVKITEEGAEFVSHIDGTKHLITPEKSMEIQKILSADIIMAFDSPVSFTTSQGYQKDNFERTLRWEERSYNHWKKIKSSQALFGVVQGETDKKLRQQSLDFILKMDFPGIAIGGETIGSNPKLTSLAFDTISDLLPDDKPVHALGLGGGPEGIFEAVERGMDTFDNTGITRMARTGIVFIEPTDNGNTDNKFRMDLNKKTSFDKKEPISKSCNCFTCSNFSKAYLHHLFKANEMLGPRLSTIHNITYINNLMRQIREAIDYEEFISLKQKWLGK